MRCQNILSPVLFLSLALPFSSGYSMTPIMQLRSRVSLACFARMNPMPQHKIRLPAKKPFDEDIPVARRSKLHQVIPCNLQRNTSLMGITAIVLLTTTLALPQVSSAFDIANAVSLKAKWWSAFAETGFYQAFSLVFLSEIGDKTFFIAGILGAKMGRFISLAGSLAALTVMTVISVIIGQVFHAVPSGFADGIPLDDVAAVLAFAFFGIKTLKEAFDSNEGGVMDEELAEAEEAVEGSQSIKAATVIGQITSIFALVFAAEFGDRSFLSTIALSAAQNPVSVAGGAIAAHAVATGIAVAGGSYISKYISEKVIGIVGGTLFLVFAVTTAIGIF